VEASVMLGALIAVVMLFGRPLFAFFLLLCGALPTWVGI
jgi:hypothetical protein